MDVTELPKIGRKIETSSVIYKNYLRILNVNNTLKLVNFCHLKIALN